MRILTALVVAALLQCSAARAQVGKTWRATGAEAFSEGKMEGVSVLSTGELQLAPQTAALEGVNAEFVWDVEPGPGGSVLVATGAPPAVFRIKGGKAEQIYKSTEPQVLSVLALADGSVLAATAPRGIIFRIKPNGEAVVFADLQEAYIWQMLAGAGNRVLCATGPNGKLIELDGAGKPTERLSVKQKNLMCLAGGKEGIYYAGTEPDGYVYHIDAKWKATVLYDAKEEEMRDIAVDDAGAVFACTASAGAGRKEAGDDASKLPPVTIPGNGKPEGANSVYRIEPGRGAVRIASAPGMNLFCLALAGKNVVVGTSPGGRILSISPEGLVLMLTELKAAHVTAMFVDADENVIVGTSNSGAVYRVGKGYGAKGTLTSKPFDSEHLSRWGRLWWKQQAAEGQSVRVRMRTGSTEKPDANWSNWSDWIEDPAGAALNVPMGRFAQFAAELTGKPGAGSPFLLEVDASYRQVNHRPKIRDLLVNGKSVLTQVARQQEPGGAVKQLQWQAADPNDDPLVYDLHFRAVGEREWKEIAKDIRDKQEYQWATDRLPDGHYLLRLTASDRSDRPGPEALSDARVGVPLLIDNRRPVVDGLAAQRLADGSYEIAGTATDQYSRIMRIQASRNAGKWATAFGTDGILDSRREAFAFRTKKLEPGEHVFVFNATDANGNTGSGKITVTVPKAN